MKLSRNIFIGGLDKDTTSELIDSKNYKMAKNVVFSGLGTDGALHNIKGSEAKAAVDTSWRSSGINRAGDWLCTGLFTSNDESKIYMFLYADSFLPSPVAPDYNDRNMLFEYTIATNTWDLVLAGIDNNINWSSLVLDANVISFRDQEFLFWLNHDGIPYKIEISEAIAFTADLASGGSYTDNEFNALTSVIQTPPLYPPTITYVSESLSDNSNPAIVGVYTFKYRYVYKNGGVSAFSPVSNIFYNQIVAESSETSDQVYYNAINVDYVESADNIENIEIAYKDGTTWFLLSPLEAKGEGSYTFVFKSNMLKAALAETPLETKYFDNVPLTAGTQEFIKNKIAYGNYLDKYDSVTDLSLSTSAIYKSKDSGLSTVTYDYTDNGGDDEKIRISKNDIENVADVGDVLYLNIKEIATYDSNEIVWVYNGYFVISDMDTILAEIAAGVLADSTVTIDGEPSGAAYFIASTGTSDVSFVYLGLEVRFFAAAPTAIILPHLNGTVVTVQAGNSTATTSFKAGANHTLGVVYYDQFNRQNDVAISQRSTAYVKALTNRGGSQDSIGSSSLMWAIDSTPPVWATHYQIVYSKNLDTNKYDTYLCDSMTLEYADATASITKKRGVISMASLKTFQEENADTQLSYIFEEGDKLRIQAVFNTTTGALVTDTTEPIIVTIKGSATDEETGIQEVYISPQSYDVIKKYIDSVSGFSWLTHKFSMEIRNSVSNAVDNLFYEVSEVYDIGNIGKATRYHKGEIRNQDEDVSGQYTQFFNKTGINTYSSDVSSGNAYTGWKTGDYVKIWQAASPTVFIYGQITMKVPSVNIIFVRTFDDTVFELPYEDVVIERIDSATGIIEHGDSYIRERTYNPLWAGGSFDEALPTTILIDTPLPSDFVKVFNDGFGRSQIISQDKKGVNRDASITISQSINEDFNFFGTTSFPNTALDFVDLDNSFSGIDELINLNDNLYVIQDSRIGIQQIAKDVLTTADGEGVVSITSNVFGNFIPILDGVGTRGIRGYTQKYEGKLFFVDPEGRSAYMVTGKEFKNITSKNLHSQMVDANFGTRGSSFIIPNRKEYVVAMGGWYVFNSQFNAWVSQLEFFGTQVINANDKYYSVNFDQLIEHEVDGVAYNRMWQDEGFPETKLSVVTITANDPKFTIKSYKSMGIVGSNLDAVETTEIYTNDSRTSKIISFKRQEGRWVADIGGGYADDSSIAEHLRGIGMAGAILGGGSSNTLIVTEVPHYVLIGDNLWEEETLLGPITVIDENNITYTGTPSTGLKFLSSSKPTAKDGMDMKGDWISTDIVFGQSGDAEYITAVELEGSPSAPRK